MNYDEALGVGIFENNTAVSGLLTARSTFVLSKQRVVASRDLQRISMRRRDAQYNGNSTIRKKARGLFGAASQESWASFHLAFTHNMFCCAGD